MYTETIKIIKEYMSDKLKNRFFMCRFSEYPIAGYELITPEIVKLFIVELYAKLIDSNFILVPNEKESMEFFIKNLEVRYKKSKLEIKMLFPFILDKKKMLSDIKYVFETKY